MAAFISPATLAGWLVALVLLLSMARWLRGWLCCALGGISGLCAVVLLGIVSGGNLLGCNVITLGVAVVLGIPGVISLLCTRLLLLMG